MNEIARDVYEVMIKEAKALLEERAQEAYDAGDVRTYTALRKLALACENRIARLHCDKDDQGKVSSFVRVKETEGAVRSGVRFKERQLVRVTTGKWQNRVGRVVSSSGSHEVLVALQGVGDRYFGPTDLEPCRCDGPKAQSCAAEPTDRKGRSLRVGDRVSQPLHPRGTMRGLVGYSASAHCGGCGQRALAVHSEGRIYSLSGRALKLGKE